MKEENKEIETRRTIEFGENATKIQTYGNKNHNGNFTKSINDLCSKGLDNNTLLNLLSAIDKTIEAGAVIKKGSATHNSIKNTLK